MSAFQLFRKRLKQEQRYQWKNTMAILDWTIVFYLSLFILFMGAMFYDMLPGILGILEETPSILILVMLYFFAWNGSIRIYFQEADSYFFIRRSDLLKGIKLYSLIASLFKTLLKAILLGSVFYYLLMLSQSFQLKFIDWLLSYCILSLFLVMVRTWIELLWSAWWRTSVSLLSFIVFGLVYYYLLNSFVWVIGAFSLTVIMGWLYLKRDTFTQDMENNEKIRQKYTGMIFSFSEYVHIPKASNRSKPFLFKHSQRIFENRSPHYALTELFFKYLLRNYRHILSYLKIIGITIGAMSLLPLWTKYGVFLAFFFFMKEWLNIVYDELVAHPFLDMQKGKQLVKEHYQHLVTRWLYYPALGAIGFALMLNTLIHFLLR
ncbi:Bacterial ABC transporter protein EcsB [Bacillus sp. THAF10]|uniref:ABC transporter permease n=1 Tax=Bacillus sp. THAF10 TaxID=2587848 RepID=UPI00126987D1|nr:ABC transporter permease [Bacillus sp. THAF10]QFT90256.1 Bacterial ABC transporter protein EcsB [Bacillus sp. THAF10]